MRRHFAAVLLGTLVLGLLGLVGPVVAQALSVGAPGAVRVEDDPAAPAEDPAPAPADPADPAQDPVPAEDPAGADSGASDPAADPAASNEPTDEPTDEPSDLASDEPMDEPTDEPTDEPMDEPSDLASGEPMDEASMEPSDLASATAVEEEVVADVPGTGAASLSLSITGGKGVQVRAQGGGLMPGSRVELWVFSSPLLLATGVADEAGNASLAADLPPEFDVGSHTVVLKGTDVNGEPVEFGSGIELGPNGELLGVTDGVDVSGLDIPALPTNPKAPPYPTVVALDSPAAVVSATIAGVALLSVTGAGLAAASAGRTGIRPGTGAPEGVAGGGINEGLSWSEMLLGEYEVDHNRGWRTAFTPRGSAPGDRSWLYRFPFTSFVDEASFLWPPAVSPRSPLLARMIDDAAPLRAMFGSLSLLAPIAAVVLAIVAAIAGDGIAQPPTLGILIALMAIGVLDALAGGLAALAFTVTVAVMGGIIDWASVRTLMGVALLIIGPALIASSFRAIRRAAPRDFSEWWERGADILIVPVLGAYTTYNIANAMPPLGGSLFPVADNSALLAWIVAGMLAVKVLVEEAAARWFPERFATVVGVGESPGTTQQVLSALLKLAMFVFISAAFIGTTWHLWVGALIWFLPLILVFAAGRLPNSPRLWQVLPQSMPYLGFGLLVYLVLAAILGSALGDSADYALVSFVVMLVPGLLLGILWMFGREPAEGDVRWYLRPSMTMLYRVGGVAVLVITTWLAVDSIF